VKDTFVELTYDNTSKFIKTKNWNIHINEAGSGETLILLHGSGPGATGWSNFSNNIPFLAEKYHVVAADMPGWGESDPVKWQDRNHPPVVAELMDEMGIDKATLIGNSMGGGTTIRFGYEFPERVNRLITMGSSSGAPTLVGPGGLTEGLKILQKVYRQPSFETMKELVDVMTYDSSFATDELIQGRADMVISHPEHNQNFIDSIGKRAVVELDHSKVATIKAPTLLFHGRDDRVVHFENSLRLSSLIPDSRIILINRCSHWLQIEHADEFNRLVDGFLTNH
jgi:2-hydroxy-6-oxonona-2,4-dienedioate hydrolase